MKILITGANGQLGRELQRQLAAGKSALGAIPAACLGAEVLGADLPGHDLAVPGVAARLVKDFAPDVVLNCAAFTNVNACESEQDTAFRANALAARNVAIACEKLGAKLVHVSTDYVFAGDASAPLDETAATAPTSVYGSTKLLGETYVRTFCGKFFIVRTSWLYGHFGGNFVKTMQKITREKGEAKVVDDQRGNPTNAEDLAHHLLQLAASAEYGIYHCTGEGVCSWYEFACEIVRLSGIDATVHPCTTADFPTPVKRPAYSALDNRMLRHTVGNHMRPWQEALAAFVAEQAAGMETAEKMEGNA